MIGFDATMLLLLLRPDSGTPVDPATGQPVTHVKKRIEHLISELEKQKANILVPTPALSEVLVRAGPAVTQYVNSITGSAVFRVVPFDTRSAIELAELVRIARDSGDKRQGGTGPWQNIKMDRQIVAICKVHGVKRLYSDDRNIRSFAEAAGIEVARLAEIALPPAFAQIDLLRDNGDRTTHGEDLETSNA
ncbi:MAG: hypothetical protein GDA49_03975 [Rhodospirillales bacterium]|nr:hypothetical protein [Rhodospirillales bacterium]